MYPPLELSKQINITNISNNNKAKPFLLDAAAGDNGLLTLLDECSGFGTAHYEGPYKEFSEYIHSQWKNMYKWATGCEPEKDVFNKSNRATVLDALTDMILCSRWGKYKRVYRFDPELELSLAAVDKVKVPLKMLDRLPFRSFYIEFAPGGIFTPAFHGCFIEVLDLKNAVGFRFLRLTSDLRSMSGSGTFHIDNTQDEPYVVIKREDVDGHHNDDPNGLRTDWEEFCFFALNAMIYLCASNADIREAKTSYDRNMPSKKLKESEQLNINECGYVYGETIRLSKEKIQTNGCIITEPNEQKAARKSPRPHPVRASWQHYWVGSGDNRQRVLLFKDPYFTGSGVKLATVSRVKE